MKKNPIIPYILIMAFGLGLIFFMSIGGADKKAELAKGGAKTEQTTNNGKSTSSSVDPESIAKQKCITCHGDNLKGSVGPNLHGTGLSEAKVKEILTKGKGTGMPAGLVSGAELDAMAKYIAGLK